MPEPAPRWADALAAARVLAAGGARLGGVHVRARAGPVRDAWLERLRALVPAGQPWLRVPPSVARERLTGGLDVAATLQAGRPVAEAGLLARARGGVLVLPMAERLAPGLAALVAGALDGTAGGLTVVALDEGDGPEEGLCAALADRLALSLPLDGIAWHDTHAAPDAPDAGVAAAAPEPADLDDRLLAALATAALAAGRPSLRTPLWLARTARILAGLDGAAAVSPEHAATALRLVCGLAPVAPQADAAADPPDTAEAGPSDAPPPEAPDGPPASDNEPDAQADGAPGPVDFDALQEMLVAAAAAARP
ncbi:magnesium chelatase ATPase subunit D, partial [Aquibium sp. A9E412]|nr:magnesium chelatase ATPase subunit D [Aquibium sp. A9E412]